MPLPQILLYAAALFCLAATGVRAARYARQPAHLRWELYPVAHEKGRAAYGGSHFEEPEHWRVARRPDRAGALGAMMAEILLLQGVRRHNRPLWLFSLPYHHGVYLIIAWAGLLILQGILGPGGPSGPGLQVVVDAVGFTGFALAFGGGLGLLGRRLGDPALRAYSAPSDLAGLALWLAYAGWTLAVHLAEGGFASLALPAAAWVRLQPAALDWPAAVSAALGALLLGYLPLSRMFHFVAKYFLYHDVRWDDAPNPRGGALEGRLARAMDFGLAWQAPHAAPARTWHEAAGRDRDGARP